MDSTEVQWQQLHRLATQVNVGTWVFGMKGLTGLKKLSQKGSRANVSLLPFHSLALLNSACLWVSQLRVHHTASHKTKAKRNWGPRTGQPWGGLIPHSTCCSLKQHSHLQSYLEQSPAVESLPQPPTSVGEQQMSCQTLSSELLRPVQNNSNRLLKQQHFKKMNYSTAVVPAQPPPPAIFTSKTLLGQEKMVRTKKQSATRENP